MNWLTGAGSIFSLFGNYYGELGSITDAEAIASDWQAVGDDMRAAMAQFSVMRNDHERYDENPETEQSN